MNENNKNKENKENKNNPNNSNKKKSCSVAENYENNFVTVAVAAVGVVAAGIGLHKVLKKSAVGIKNIIKKSN